MENGSVEITGNELNKSQRNYGIDLLRLTAVFFVVILHSLGHGGVLSNVPAGTLAYAVVWLLEIASYGAVNIFVILAGYTSCLTDSPKKNLKRLIIIWLEVLFYSVFIYLILVLLGKISFDSNIFLERFFPVRNNLYWYFSCYFGFYFVKPFLDKAVDALSKKQLKICTGLLFLVYSVFFGNIEVFVTFSGQSVIWFVVLYLIGASAKKCRFGESLSSVKIILIIITMICITWAWLLFGKEFRIFSQKYNRFFLLSYKSPTITIMALFYVVLFSRFRFHKNFISIIRFASPSAFAVYLINDNPHFRELILSGSFASLAARRTSVIVGTILLFSISFLIAAVLIDKIRQLIFRKLKIGKAVSGFLDSFRWLETE